MCPTPSSRSRSAQPATSSLRRRTRRYITLLVLAVLLLVAMVAFNAIRPAATLDDDAQAFRDIAVQTDFRNLGEAERESLRRQWETFSPDTRQAIFAEIARDRIREMREQTHGLPPEQRTERIQQAILQMRQRHESISVEERTRVRERLNSGEAKEMIQHVMDVYMNELTAKERAEMDPLLHEWLFQVERLAGGR